MHVLEIDFEGVGFCAVQCDFKLTTSVYPATSGSRKIDLQLVPASFIAFYNFI